MTMSPNQSLRRTARVLIGAGMATFISLGVIFAVMGEVTKPATVANPRGFTQAVYWLEVFTDRMELFQILGEPGTEVGTHIRLAMDRSARWDFLFMASYTALMGIIFLFLDRLGRAAQRDDTAARPVLAAGIALSLVILVADAAENLQIFRLLAAASPDDVSDGTMTALIIWTRIKWFGIFLACALAAWRYGLLLSFRRPAGLLFTAIYGTAAATGTLGLTVGGAGLLLEISGTVLALGWLSSMVHAGTVYRKTASR